ncbi:thiol peroxidase [bacterium]|nr:thiol peroxidase [bacterium]
MKERTGKLTIKGSPLTLLGEEIKVGQKAPDFTVRTAFMPETKVTLDSSKGKIRIFSVSPSLDTSVCETQAIRFNQEAAKLGDVEIYHITVDLPPAQARFCTHQLEGSAKVKMVSDYAEKSFGMNYGIIIKEWQVLSRGIFVIGKDDMVKYVEYLPEVAQLPNFDKALEAVKSLR